MIRRFLSATLVGVAMTCVADGPEGHFRSVDDVLSAIQTHAIVADTSVAAPLGHFILLRNNLTLCAVRFDSLQRGHNEKSPTMFSSGDESFFAEADLYRWTNGSADLSSQKATSEHIALSSKALVGIGRLAFHRGNSAIACGNTTLLWNFPTWVALFVGDDARNRQIEIAPTAWTDVAQVNLSDPNLKWYMYDEARKLTLLPLIELPGAVQPH